MFSIPELNAEVTRIQLLFFWDTIRSTILDRCKTLDVGIFEQFSILTTKYVHERAPEYLPIILEVIREKKAKNKEREY